MITSIAPKYLDLKSASLIYSIKIETLRYYIKIGALPKYKIHHGRVLVKPEDIEAIITQDL